MKWQSVAAIAFGAIFLSGCETAKVPELTGLELPALQARDFESSKAIVFPSVMTVLQDAGYIIESADLETGFITANSPTQSNTTWV